MEYYFQGEEHTFEIQPHGNSKGNQAFIPTTFSTKVALQEKASKLNSPRMVINEVSESVGGLLGASSESALPRNIKQVYNLSTLYSKHGKASVDPYAQLVMKSKEEYKKPEEVFIRSVVCAPEPVVILASNQQLSDLKKFCTNDLYFTILEIDPTFNLGNFSVTATCYRHLLLHNKESKTFPIMVGPVLIHQRKEYDTYSIFTDFLAKQVKTMKAIGTDGEEALTKACKSSFPSAVQLRCFLHFERNIKEYLKRIGVDEANRKLICADLLGQQIGVSFEEGLVDSNNNEEFESRLNSLLNLWKDRLGDKGTEFYRWFTKYKKEVMKSYMLKPVRAKSGLGNPPKKFTTNGVECVNSLLKKETNHALPADQFVAKVSNLVDRQKKNVEWALIGKGPLKMHPSIQSFEISSQRWFQFTQVLILFLLG